MCYVEFVVLFCCVRCVMRCKVCCGLVYCGVWTWVFDMMECGVVCMMWCRAVVKRLTDQ